MITVNYYLHSLIVNYDCSFKSALMSQQMDDMDDDDEGARPLAESLLLAISDLLFCPEFTVQSHKRGGPVSNLSESRYSLYPVSLLLHS